MKLSTITAFGLFLGSSQAHRHRFAREDPETSCVTTQTRNPITVTAGGGNQYTQCYTVVYDEFYPQGLQPHSYTVTQTCSELVCRQATETAPPPGFTCAAVVCSSCGSPGPHTETLTFPVSSIAAYSSSGYIVKPTEAVATPAPGAPGNNNPSAPAPTGGKGTNGGGSGDNSQPAASPALGSPGDSGSKPALGSPENSESKPATGPPDSGSNPAPGSSNPPEPDSGSGASSGGGAPDPAGGQGGPQPESQPKPASARPSTPATINGASPQAINKSVTILLAALMAVLLM